MKAAIAMLTLALAGCAPNNGVKLSDADEVTCARDGCTAWSDAELMALIKMGVQRGFESCQQAPKEGI